MSKVEPTRGGHKRRCTGIGLTCQAILFDLDGVLVDSAGCVEHTWYMWAARHGLDGQEVMRTAHGRFALDTVRLMAPHLDAEAELRALVIHESSATDGVFEVPGARALLDSLPRNRWAVVTSGVRAVAEHRLRHVGLPGPPVMVCGGEVARGKPAPDAYLAAAGRLGIAPVACIVMEDAPLGVQAAKAAGMRVVGLTTTHSTSQLENADATAASLGDVRVRLHGEGSALILELDVSIAP